MNYGTPPGKRTELVEICWYDNVIGKTELGVQTVFEPQLEESLIFTLQPRDMWTEPLFHMSRMSPLHPVYFYDSKLQTHKYTL